jgi:hypothetical protein
VTLSTTLSSTLFMTLLVHTRPLLVSPLSHILMLLSSSYFGTEVLPMIMIPVSGIDPEFPVTVRMYLGNSVSA